MYVLVCECSVLVVLNDGVGANLLVPVQKRALWKAQFSVALTFNRPFHRKEMLCFLA